MSEDNIVETKIIVSPDGSKHIRYGNIEYWIDKNGDHHKNDGPAYIICGEKWWYKHGKRHRIDGPAIEYINGDKIYYIDGKHYTEQNYNRVVKLLFLI